jgi:hypothetical protein
VLTLALITLILVPLSLGILAWARPQGFAVLAGIFLLLLDVGLRSILEQTSLYVSATYSQPALRAEGVVVGTALFGALAVALYRQLRSRSWSSLVWLRLSLLDKLVLALAILAVSGAVIGDLNGNKQLFVLGDTYRILVVPAAYFVIRITAARADAWHSLIIGAFVVGLGVAAVQCVKILERIAHGQWLNGVGSPPLITLAVLLAVLAFASLTWRRYVVTCAAFLAVTGLILLSLTRGLWIVAVVMIVAATALGRMRGMVRILLPTAVVATAAVALAVTSTTVVGRQLHARLRDVIKEEHASMSLLPVPPATSVDERQIEANDAIADEQTHGPAAFVIGRGSGAEYATALPRIETTSSDGHRHQIHVTWVSLIFRYGFIGLALVLAIIGVASRLAIRALRRSRGEERIAPAALCLWLLGTTLALTNSYGFLGELAWGIVLAVIVECDRARAGRAQPA